MRTPSPTPASAMPYQRDPDAGGYVSENDPYLDESGVLINALGITNTRDLNEAEADFTYQRAYQLVMEPIFGGFDLLHLQAIHRHLFQDVYPWAGEVRRVDIEKGDSRFAHFRNLVVQANTLLAELANEGYLRHLSEEAFSSRAGYYLGEINALHLFREGNGRTQREFMQQLAHQAGYHITWDQVGTDAMVQGCIQSFCDRDYSRLSRLIRINLVPLET